VPSVPFYRATIARTLRPVSKKGSPEAVMLTAFSFWHPFSENVLEDKLQERMLGAAYDGLYVGKGQTAYEEEPVDSGESVGLGFYRWSIVGKDDAVKERLGPRWIFTPLGEEKFWSDRPRERRKYILGE